MSVFDRFKIKLSGIIHAANTNANDSQLHYHITFGIEQITFWEKSVSVLDISLSNTTFVAVITGIISPTLWSVT